MRRHKRMYSRLCAVTANALQQEKKCLELLVIKCSSSSSARHILLACSRLSFWKAIESHTKYISRMDHLDLFHTIPVEMWASERKDIARVLLDVILDTTSQDSERSASCQRSMSCLLDIDMSDSLCASPRVEIEQIALRVAIESADTLVRVLAQHLKTPLTRPLHHNLRGAHDDSVRFLFDDSKNSLEPST